MFITYYVLLISNMIVSFKKKGILGKIIFFLGFIFLWVLYFGNTDNPDLLSYKSIYNGYDDTVEIGFRFIIKLGNYFNFDFKTFICVVSLICLLLVFSTVTKFAKDNNYVLALYFIYPFVLDVIQFRNFIATSIVIFAIRFIYKNDKKNKVYYIVCIILASTIHKLSIVYMIFLLIDLKNRNRLIKVIVILTLFSCILIFMNGNTIPFLGKLNILSEGKYEYYFSNKLGYGFLVYWFFDLLYVFMVYISRKRSITNWNGKEIYNAKARYIDLILWVNILSITFFPMYMLNINFYRLFRNISVLNYTVYAITNRSFDETSQRGKWKYNFIILTGVICIFIYDIYTNYEYVFRPILENNIFTK